MATEDLAWCAGFFDGEGCFSISKSTTRHPHKYASVRINQVHREVLDRFALAVEVGKVRGPYQRGPNQPIYVYSASTWCEVKTIADLLWPWLGTIKRDQAERVLNESKKTQLRLTDSCRRGHLISEVGRSKWGQCKECLRASARKSRAKKVGI
jgi:hypothetical protein